MHSLNPWPWPTPAPGVYFNMSHADYLAIPAMSNGGIKDALVAAPNFWNESWLNPFRTRKEAKHFTDGTAYHHRILFGKDRFYQEYAPTFTPPEGVIDGNKAMVEALDRVGVTGHKTKTAPELAKLMAEHLPQLKCKINLERAYVLQHEGKELIAPDLIREIELGAKAIECNPHINHWLLGGYPEVTVIWWDERLGVMCKCRFDYLKIGSATDLKTVMNEKGRDFEKAVDYAIAGNKYIIQPAWYLPGAEAARTMIRAGMVYGAEDVDPAWLEEYGKTPVEEFRFIFQQKKMALVTEGRIYSLRNQALADQGNARIAKGIARFKEYYAAFGKDDIWFSISKPQHIDVNSLPAFMSDL